MSAITPFRTIAGTAAAAALGLTLAACGGSTHSGHGAASASATAASPDMPGMSGMDSASVGDGLAAARDGYTFTSGTRTLPASIDPTDYRFTITGPDGKPVTAYTPDQTKKLHFYAVRSDLTGFQHIHPTLAADGTWTAHLDGLDAGEYRFFAAFTPAQGAGAGQDFVLSRTVRVPGAGQDHATPLPQPSSTATVDGYTVTVRGELMSGMAHPLEVRITRDGKPATDLQPYLGTAAHLTAFHSGDQAFAHLHPTSTADSLHTGALTFHAELPSAGTWRLYLQFQTAGRLHTAALTLHAN